MAPLPPDTRAPIALVAGVPSSARRRTLEKSGVRGYFSCSEACGAVFELLLGKTVIGTVTVNLGDAGIGKFTLKLSSAGKKALRTA